MRGEKKGQIAIDKDGNLYLVEMNPEGNTKFYAILNGIPVTPPNSLKSVSCEFGLNDYGRAYT